ncbi:CIS tube protein [Spirosoma panaciterrae]|uniref:CIS tube protein n=1 Tax=Spirosoma panaciterrae TaxID=496058 RepID=UPI00036FB36E|nr:hypothetical protein [Spirosoma panaciterrae]
MADNGTLEKVMIQAYEDRDMQKKATERPFALPINPETYSQSYKVENESRVGSGNQGTNPNYVATLPEELKLDFFFDGTNTVEGYAQSGNVREQIQSFLTVVYRMDGKKHRPNFLQIIWGKDTTFFCVLKNLDINYTLFQPNGTPLRAKLSAVFTEYKSPEYRVRTENKQSPDLTHRRQVTKGDRLDLMTYRIYEDSQYVLQIAKANRLTTFRQLKPGQTLLFPPFDPNEIVV